MDKRKLSKIPRKQATAEMIETAGRLGAMQYMVTANVLEDIKILQLTFYEIRTLREGKPDAAFRTFLSDSDYITQDLKVSNVKWLTASFSVMDGFDIFDRSWNEKEGAWDRKGLLFIRSGREQELITTFFKEYADQDDTFAPWDAVCRFQEKVKAERLGAKHKKETDRIDAVMEPVKQEPEEFRSWAFEVAMGFSRYLIYQEVKKGIAQCECTHCGKIGTVNRKKVRLKNNEEGVCPFCGSKVMIKAKGRLAYRVTDERWVVLIDPADGGFIWRYFYIFREIHKYPEQVIGHGRVSQGIRELARVFYTFPEGKPKCDPYEYAEYKQTGKERWCHSQGRLACGDCILYPGNLPQAWAHTPMKYSALEVLAKSWPTTPVRYENGVKRFLEFPELEWLCKMGLNRLAREIINDTYHGLRGKIDRQGGTIYKILGLNRENTRILQALDGNGDELRLLQTAQKRGLRLKPEQLKEFYKTFTCNTALLDQAGRKVSLHKLVRYIEKESERYPLGEDGGCGRYAPRCQEHVDPRTERKWNMAKDWLEYLGWCRELKYDLDNLFIYMPTNFKKVHDRTAKEYQALQNKRAAAERKRQETLAKKQMEQTKKAMEEIFKKNKGTDAFSIKGKGLILVAPENGEEIRAEGEALHHCVGGYVGRVASGETSIFFIRKAEAPKEPYFTLEYKDGKVAQCRGLRNCGMPPEVKAFVNVFEKKMHNAAQKEKKAGKREKEE